MDGTVNRTVLAVLALAGMLLVTLASRAELLPCYEDGSGLCLSINIGRGADVPATNPHGECGEE